ncbi:MAG TPA: hypothetical protein VN083_08290 [Vicinamibacteria bacterium]|jgi:hypothetical protein|nr:hypothetical protein [Vicinamibacteria bacterium]
MWRQTAAIVLGVAWVSLCGPSGRAQDRRAGQVIRSYVQTLAAAPSVVFPLLGPVEEARWAEGWAPELLSSEAGIGEGTVFRTRHGGVETVWILTLWDPVLHRVGYAHVTAGSDVATLRIDLLGVGGGMTEARVTYIWTALSDQGAALIDRHTQERFESDMRDWETALNHYLKTGQRLEHHGH